jgi:hypothetical protein
MKIKMHLYHPKIDENVVIFVTHDMTHGPLNTAWHLMQFKLHFGMS